MTPTEATIACSVDDAATNNGAGSATGAQSAVRLDGEPAVRLDGVSAGYGSPVIEDISFDLAPGRWLTVIGPNGSGKSTLLKTIAGIKSFSGSIELAGTGHRGRTDAAKRVGYVPQTPMLPDGMTTAEYVLLGRTAHLRWLQSESRRDRLRVAEVLEQLRLSDLAGRRVGELSGGEAQRATLARALVQEATVLVLDEPTSALDLAHQISVLELVDELRTEHGLTVISALHDLTIASRFADRLLLLSEGRTVATGGTEDVLNEEVLSRYYRTPVSVMDGPDGGVVVVPLRTGSALRQAGPTNGPNQVPKTDRSDDPSNLEPI